MSSDFIVQLFNHYGFLIFFLAFCLGPFGVSVPSSASNYGMIVKVDAQNDLRRKVVHIETRNAGRSFITIEQA